MIRSSKVVISAVLLVLSMSAAQQPSPSTATEPSVSLVLSTTQPTVRAGTDVSIDAVTSNLCARPVAIGFLPGPYDSDILTVTLQVRNDQDRPVGPESVDQHSCAGRKDCHVTFLESRILPPGKSVQDHILLSSKKYDFSHPGTYTLQLIRKDKRTQEVNKSNTLTIAVTP